MKPLFPAITVNGVEISAQRIANEAQNHPAPKDKPGYAYKDAARALAVRELLLQEAGRRGIAAAPQEVAAGQVETEEEALIRQLLEAAVTPPPPDEAELRAAYAANPERFRSPSLYEAAHILIAAAPEDAAARAQALDRAQALIGELGRDPGRFADLARTQSACSSRESGGLLGQLSAGDTVPEFEAALATMREGSITPEPVRTRYGFHIIRLDARAEGAVLPFESVAPKLREAHMKAAWVHGARAFIAELVARAEITGVTMDAA